MESWASHFVKDITRLTDEKLLQLISIMNKMGIDQATRQDWMKVVEGNLEDLFQETIQDALSRQGELINTIEQLLEKLFVLCKKLRMPSPAYDAGPDATLSEEKKKLEQKIAELECLVAKREKEIEKLKARQRIACKSLGRKLRVIPEIPLLTSDEIDEFTEYIDKLEEENFNRLSHYCTIKPKIMEIAEMLKVKPSLDLEKLVLSSGDELFEVTDDNMKWLENFHESLIKLRESIKEKMDILKERVNNLWEILSEDIQRRSRFLQDYSEYNLENLEQWKLELKRCEDYKRANIETFVKQYRAKLRDLWEKCHLTDIERENFEYFHCDIFTEDLVTFHELEINRLEKYYDDNKEMFMLLQKWNQYWNRLVELEDRATAPDRYKNRGGTLLKEEKEKNALEKKKLPEIEQRLYQLANNFCERTSRPFFTWGLTVHETIDKSRTDREMDKKVKLSARKQQREILLTPGKATGCASVCGSKLNLLSRSNMNLNTIIKTPQTCSTKKRPPLTPLFGSNVLKKTRNAVASSTKTAPPKITVSADTLKRRSRNSMERKRRLKMVKRYLVDNKQENAVDENGYRTFMQELSSKEECRSTLCVPTDELAVPLPVTPSRSQSNATLVRTQTYTVLNTAPGSTMKF